MALRDIFEHPRLNSGREQFRVIKLEAPQVDGSVRCRMLVHDVDDPSPYTALSYMWGIDSPVNTIVVDGKHFSVRSNLAQFLQRAQNGMVTAPIFIDALCINQEDTDERNQQVKLMGQIYANATRVISWLGHSNGQVEAAIPFIKQFLPLSNELLQNFYKDRESNIREAQQEWSTVHTFCALRYWTRIWMVQEILKAKLITFVYGDESIEGHDLFEFSQALRETNPCPAPLADQLFRSRLFSYLDGSSTKPLYKTGSIMQAKLIDVLWEYGLSACGEKRDRVYALLSLAKEGQQFPVDYDISLTALFLQVWQFRPRTGSHLMAFTKHMIEALLDNWKDINEAQDAKKPKSYKFELHRVEYSRGSFGDNPVLREEGFVIGYNLACSGPLQALRTRAWPFFNLVHPEIRVRVDIDQIKNQDFKDGDEVYNIENSGLLVVTRRDAQNELQIIAKLGLSVGLAHSDGKAGVTARWLPWSSLLAKLKSHHQAFSAESVGGKVFMCFNEMALRTFLAGVSYERHSIQVLNNAKDDAFEVDLISVHWNILPAGDFSLDEVAMLQDIGDHSSKNKATSSPLSLLRAVRSLTRSVIDLARTEDAEEEEPLPWRQLLEREEDSDGPITSQLHKLFY